MTKIIKFEKPNCQPCVAVGEILDEMNLTYEAINPFDQPDLAAKYRIRTVPTVVVLNGDQEVKRIVGVDSTQLKALAEPSL